MTITFSAVAGLGEIRSGDDIAALIAHAIDLQPGDVVVVTSKIVSKAAGLTTRTPKPDLLTAQTDRVVAQRGETKIVRTHHGLTLAAAGIDASNTDPGTLIPLPPDPDASSREIRARLHHLTGLQVAVIISDTAGRAWRNGQTDIAIGCAGIAALDSFAGRTDAYGNDLVVTAPAIADQIAGGAELASGKLGANPVVVVRGIDPHHLLAEDGTGAAALIREESGDLFGLGSREAVTAALGDGRARGFPSAGDDAVTTVMAAASSPVDLTDLTVELTSPADRVIVSVSPGRPDAAVRAGELAARLRALAVAYDIDLPVDVVFADVEAGPGT